MGSEDLICGMVSPHPDPEEQVLDARETPGSGGKRCQSALYRGWNHLAFAPQLALASVHDTVPHSE